MSITTTTRQSWFGRMGGAFKGILVGMLLTLVSVPLLFWNEGRAVHRAQTLARGRDLVVGDVSIEQVDPDLEGKLVHLTGVAESAETLADETFGISVERALRLRRQVEMFQWREDKRVDTKKKLGGGTETETTYTYEKIWSPQWIDSSHFNARGQSVYGSGNPPMAVPPQDWTASRVSLGAFELSEDQIRQIANYQPVPVESLPATLQPPEQAPAVPAEDGVAPSAGQEPAADPNAPQDGNASAAPGSSIPVEIIEPEPTAEPASEASGGDESTRYHLRDNLVYRGANPDQPEVGDLRITFESVGPTEVSLIYQQAGNRLVPYQLPSGSIALFTTGRKSAEEMIQDAETANTIMLWALRFLGFVLMAVGLGLILRPLAVLGDVVPFVGSLVGVGIGILAMLVAGGLSMLTIAVAWLFYRPLLGGALLAVSVFLFWMARRYLRSRKPEVVEIDQPVVLD